MPFLGIDIGSVSLKMAFVEADGAILEDIYLRHRGEPARRAFEVLHELFRRIPPEEIGGVCVTGSGGQLLAGLLGVPFVNEIVALSRAAGKFCPHVRSCIEIGGEDSKLTLLEYDPSLDGMIITDFAMNTICAAGTGSFLDQQASRMSLSIEEFGELALRSKNPPRIAGRCSVFAKTDMIHLQQQATPDYDIIAGLCFALARNFISNISKGKKIAAPVAFLGGVSANRGMERAFREVLNLDEGSFFVPAHAFTMIAIGAALMAREKGRGFRISLVNLERHLGIPRRHEGLESLSIREHYMKRFPTADRRTSQEKIPAYLGVDVGSISTNVVVLSEDGRVLSKRYLMTAGRPLEAVRQGLDEVGREVGDLVEIRGVCTTGSGRYLTGDFIGADLVKNEITAQAKGALEIDPAVDTIFEIGGQDSKFISLDAGAIVDFEMNKVCAAGTGSFLEEQAEKLGIRIEEEFGKLALLAPSPVRLGERCTVFMESDLVHHQQAGCLREDLVGGLAYSIVYNYLNRVMGGKRIGRNIFFQGGVAFNRGVVAAFEKVTGKSVTVPEHHEVTGAIGCALLAKEYMQGRGRSSFKGFDLSKKSYAVESFECGGCPNSCEINKVIVEGEKPLFYGGRCEKYEVRRKSDGFDRIPDLFAERERMLLGGYKEKAAGETKKLRVGIPLCLHFYEYMPFWRSFFESMGFEVVLSDRTNKTIINDGLESVLAESCFPVKISHGHVLNLLQKKIDFLFLPSVVSFKKPHPNFRESVPCPYVQSIPYTIKAAIALGNVKLLSPVVGLQKGLGEIKGPLRRMLWEMGVSSRGITRALQNAESAQENFYREIRVRGEEILKGLKIEDKAVVIVSRPYNGCDSGINLELPRKFRSLGALPIPMDFLPLDRVDLSSEWPSLTWRYGQKILASAEIIREDPRLNAVYITNFGCGPDSFLLKFFRAKLGGKVFLQIEVDEHNADVGAITRAEAFLDSLKSIARIPPAPPKLKMHGIEKKTKRTIYIPYMCDHAYAVCAAFLASDVPAAVMPESDDESLVWGRKFTTGKECFPCIVTTGDMVKMVLSREFDRRGSAFFMPTAGGGCRFGYYNILHRMVLDELGFHEVPIFSPNQNDTLYHDLGIVGSGFVRKAWQGIVCVDILFKALCEIRPYEIRPGEAERIYHHFVERVCAAILGGHDLLDVMREARSAFEKIPADRGVEKPRIGVVGEIFVRMHRFSNNHLIRELESLGAEVWLAPFTEWIFYLNVLRRIDSWKNRDFRNLASTLIEDAVQKRDEHRLMAPWEGFLRSNHEPPAEQNLAYGKPYLDPSFRGEAILSVGKAADFVHKGISGIVNVMPFTCMPGTVVSGVLKAFREDHKGVPCLNLAYDGLEQTNTAVRLEAFVHQARQFMARSGGGGRLSGEVDRP